MVSNEPTHPEGPTWPRRTFLGSVAAGSLSAIAAPLSGQAAKMPAMLGPICGHADQTSAMVWLRPTQPGEYVLEVTPTAGGDIRLLSLTAREENDLCLHWHVTDLKPGSKYRYRILHNGQPVADHKDQLLATDAAADAPAKIRLAVSSCALEDAGSRAVWKQMAAEGVEAVLLLGDTPYIDSTALDKQTRRYQEFAAVPEYQALLRSRPCWWTWDDHDFAFNNCDGRAKGKENSRLAFSRYRSLATYGDGTDGIYTSFRRGPVEVFLIDARWFSNVDASFADPAKPGLLGQKQWEWLQKGLLASTAPFKFLACGIIWDDKQNKETDDWGTYPHELEAVKKFIADHRIPGVVFVGGDIHASRVLRYNTKKAVGYDLVQLIASPIHASVIPSLNVYHPNLVRSAVEPNVFLLVEADATTQPPQLHATLVNKAGERVFSYHLTANDLKPA